MHSLLEWLVDSKLESIGLARGREGTDHEKSLLMINLRQELSLAAAKAQSACLLGRMAKMGEGYRLATTRRAWAKREQEKRQEAAKAQWFGIVSSHGMLLEDDVGRKEISWIYCTPSIYETLGRS